MNDQRGYSFMIIKWGSEGTIEDLIKQRANAIERANRSRLAAEKFIDAVGQTLDDIARDPRRERCTAPTYMDHFYTPIGTTGLSVVYHWAEGSEVITVENIVPEIPSFYLR